MSEDPISHSKAYALEKWWHRLLRVLIYVATITVTAIAAIALIEDVGVEQYVYSFEPDYESSPGQAIRCTAYDYIESITCGKLKTADDLVEYYVQVRGHQSTKSGDTTISEAVDELHRRGFSNAQIARKLIRSKDISYRRFTERSAGDVGQRALYALIIGALSYLVLLAAYRAVLFVVHGHTRVRKEKPPA